MAPRRLGRRLGRKLCRTKRSSPSPSTASSGAEDAKQSSRPSPAAHSNTQAAPLGTQTNPAHVLNRDTPRGWAVIQRAVDEFDKDQIEGVKNDIDTLLVFIGLFSAVLSAFLVVAVALLQEDIPGATLTTLRQIQSTNYTIQGNFIISMPPTPTSSPPFEPSVNAIRINDLWAASLVISLATASFGILVKQWLREYMKFVTSFPQGRLRIRNFRRAGLETWKVLTIAACLPLLLQLALGLFFVGLCFYTAELHSSVKNTTLPLVAGWGFIFFFVTISPLFSAHCPYKTPALDLLVVAVRRSARIQWKTLLGGVSTRAMTMQIYWYSSLRGRMARATYFWTQAHLHRLNSPTEPYEEVAAAKHEAGDLDIMADADKLQGNDEIVGTAMVDALQLITPSPEDIIRFVLKILQHRVPWEGNFESPPQIIDCSMATSRAVDSIHSILEQHLRINDILIPSVTDFESGPIASWTAALYLSLWTHHSFEKMYSLPWEPFNKRPEVFLEVAMSLPSASGLRALLHLTCQSCQQSNLNLAQSLTRIKSVFDPFFQMFGLTGLLEFDIVDPPWRKVLTEDSLRETVAFLTNLLRDDTAAQDGEWSDPQHDALSLIIKLIAIAPWPSRDSIAAVRRITLSSKSDAVMVKLLTLLIKSHPRSFYYYMDHVDVSMDTAALSRVAAAIETIATDSPDQLTRLSVLTACEGVARILYDVKDDVKNTTLTESWREIFAALTPLVQAAPVLEGRTHEEAGKIDWCFNWLVGVDARNEGRDHNDDVKYREWRAAFKPEDSPIPDGFCLALMKISIPEGRFWRVSRLQEMSAEEREAAKRDIEPYLHKHGAENLNNSVAGLSTERGEGSGARAGASDGTGRADAPGEAEEGGNPGNDSEIVAEGSKPNADVAFVLGPDGLGLEADAGRGNERDATALEEAARRNSEAVKRSHTKLPEDMLPEADAVAENSNVLLTSKDDQEMGSARDSGGQGGMNSVAEGVPDDTSPQSVLFEPGDKSDVLTIKYDGQGTRLSGDDREQAGTDSVDERNLDNTPQRPEDERGPSVDAVDAPVPQ